MTKRNILIVENESVVALDIQDCLHSSNYTVVAISQSGKDALALVESKKPNLVLMDIQLDGEMDGAETALTIRLRYGLPVLFLTAFTDKVSLDRARLAHPYGYIVKPFQDRELLANIEIALYKHEQELLFLRNRDWLAHALSAFNDGIILIDRYKNIVFMNARAGNLTGWTGEVIGSPLKEIFQIYQEKTDSIVSKVNTDFLVDEAMSNNMTIDFKEQTPLTGKDGHKVHFDGSITSISAPDGSAIGAVLVFQSIDSHATEGKSAPDSRIPPQNIVEVTESGTISSVNPGTERVFGYKAPEIIGKNIEDLLPKPFYSFIHKSGAIYPIHNAINKMRIKERSAFIGLLCHLAPHTPAPAEKT